MNVYLSLPIGAVTNRYAFHIEMQMDSQNACTMFLDLRQQLPSCLKEIRGLADWPAPEALSKGKTDGTKTIFAFSPLEAYFQQQTPH